MATKRKDAPAGAEVVGAGGDPGGTAAALPAGVVWKGNPKLVPFLVPIGSVFEDPGNANKHPGRSIASIAGSYARFGQQKPIVCASDMTVRDGNGQLRAAAERLGWTHVAAIHTDLEGVELSAYALAVNQTAKHSEFDFDVVAEQLRAIQRAGAGIDDLGWDEAEYRAILGETAPPAPPPEAEPAAGQFGVVVMCEDEADQKAAYDALVASGYNCKVVCV